MRKKRCVKDAITYRQTKISNYFKSSNSNFRMSKLIERREKAIMQAPSLDSDGTSLPYKIPHYSTDSDDSEASANVRKRKLVLTEKKCTSSSSINEEASQKKLQEVQHSSPNKENDNKQTPLPRKIPRMSMGVHFLTKRSGESSNKNLNCSANTQSSGKVQVISNLVVNPGFRSSTPVQTHFEKSRILTNCTLTPIQNVNKNNSEPGCSRDTVECSSPQLKVIDKTTNAPENKISSDYMENISHSIALNIILKIIRYVIEHKALRKLLNDQEMETLERYLNLPKEEYKFCCLRLFTRLKLWYNIFHFTKSIKLNLSDPEVMQMYECLTDTEFVDTDYSQETPYNLMQLLHVSDLKKICDEFRIQTVKLKKQQLIERLMTNSNRQTTLTPKSSKELLLNAITKKLGQCFKLSENFCDLLTKVHLLYSFTSSEYADINKLYRFLGCVVDGSITLPQHSINSNIEIFSSSAEFMSYKEACDCYASVENAIEKKETSYVYQFCNDAYIELKKIVASIIPVATTSEAQPPLLISAGGSGTDFAQYFEKNHPDVSESYLKRFTPGHKYTKALWSGLKHLTKHYTLTVQEWLIFLLEQRFFCLYLRGLWYNHLIMIQYTHLKRYKEASESVINALKDTNLNKIYLMDLSKRADKIKNNKAHTNKMEFGQISSAQPIPIESLPEEQIDAQAYRSDISGKKRKYYEKVENGFEIYSVEEVAMKFYKKNGYTNAMHCEGSLLLTIFGVLLWDIIYNSEVPYAFINEIQSYPLDMYCREFYTNRREGIEQRLRDIEFNWSSSELSTFICDTWQKHSSETSLISSWIVDKPEDLYDIVMCIGRLKIRQIIDRFLEDFCSHRAGLPDLFIWSVEEPTKCKFVEVKGENDHLSSKQECWLDFLRSIGADIAVCHVHTMGSKRKVLAKKEKGKIGKEEPKEKRATLKRRIT